jgi:DNA polymerase III delta subunit
LAPLALLERVGAPGAAGSGEFPPTVYLEGSDEAVKAAFLAEFRRCWAAAVPEAPHARVMRPDEHDVDQILAAFLNVSLFAPRELTFVLEIEDVGRSEKRVEVLADGISRPAGGSCLVLVESEAETVRKTLAPLRAACAVRVVAEHPEPQQLLRWGVLRLAAQGCRAEPGALEALLATCEDDAIAFMNETGKLAALAGEQGVVTKPHVAALTAPSIGAGLAEFLDAVAKGDAANAALRLERLLAAGESEGGVLWALGHLVSSSFVTQTGGWAKWRDASFALARRRSAASRAQALDAVYRAESAWKGGRADVRTALEQATREVVAG